jgi:hypothetical protein
MSAFDWIRIRRTMLAYDYWMDVQGVPGRRRKELRAELVGNLTDASATVGYPAARRSLGSVRALAGAAVPDRDSRPRWVVGSYAALVVFAVVAFATLGMTTAWADGVLAAGGSTIDVTGHPVFLPWAEITVHKGERLQILAAINPLSILLPMLLAFLLGSRIWRLATGQPTSAHAAQAR